MTVATPLIARPDDPLAVGSSPRFDGERLVWERLSCPLNAVIHAQPDQVLVSATPGQRIYCRAGNWQVELLEASLSTAAAHGATEVEIRHGAALLATLSIPAGQLTASFAVAVDVVIDDYLQVRVVSAGVGAKDLGVQLSGRALLVG